MIPVGGALQAHERGFEQTGSRMQVCRLQLSSFRNYRELDLVPGERLNILYGENAQGKSNVLEALSMLATTRSLRATRESELVLRDAESAHVNAEIAREREGDAELQVSVFQGDKKSVRINGLKRPRVLELLGQFNAVSFGSLDLRIVAGEPSDRRHYLNVEISQISPRYVYDLGHYKRVLEQRNRLLRDLRDRPGQAEDSGLTAWNEQLVRFGAPLIEKRRFYIDRLAPIADRIHQELTEGRESLSVRYMPSVPLTVPAPAPAGAVRDRSPEDRYLAAVRSDAVGADGAAATEPPPAASSDTESIAAAIRRQLTVVKADEARRGTTLLGPQRDDLCLFINGAEARIYGSQGQQRTVALALKLAEFQLIEDYVGEPPVMLLDDVMSDLDDARRAHLLAWIQRRCQTFLTCTNLRAFPDAILREAKTFHVVAGTVTEDDAGRADRRPIHEPEPPAEAAAAPDGGSEAGNGRGKARAGAGKRAEPERDPQAEPEAVVPGAAPR
jgi:DNA replication and repair protein RecF